MRFSLAVLTFPILCVGVGWCAEGLPRPTSHVLPPYYGLQPDVIDGVSGEPATGRPLVRHVCLVAPDMVELTIDAGAIATEPVHPYRPQPGDEVRLGGYEIEMRVAEAAGVDKWTTDAQREAGKTQLFRYLRRGGKDVGFIVGPNADLVRPYQRFEGEALDTAWADRAASYRVTSGDEAGSGEGLEPVAVYRKSRPCDAVRFGGWPKKYAYRHEIYLKMPRALTHGKRYAIEFSGGVAGTPEGRVVFPLDARRLRSEAVHVNLAGYHPAQARRRALLLAWTGTGGGIEYAADTAFEVVDDASGKTVYRGKAEMIQPGDEPEYTDLKVGPRNANGCSVYGLDFSEFKTPGRYRVVVEGVGCSFPFAIGRDVWRDALWLQMKGFLHQRASLELGPPYTTWQRPNCFHPAMGKVVHLCDMKTFNDDSLYGEGEHNPFERIQKSIRLDTSHPGAWGGWMDAGDFDRSLAPQRHYRPVHAMLDLYESAPDYFRDLNLNIPESGNAIPDVIDEALWCTELFRRVQQDDGGMPSAVESIEHPRIGEPSWLDSIPAALTPPTPDTCYAWAATAAHMAWVLRDIDAGLSKKYRQSAERALAWVEKHPDAPDLYLRNWMPPDFSKNAAAAYMLQLTDEAKYSAMFVETFAELEKRKKDNHRLVQRAMLVYAMRESEPVDTATREACRKTIVRNADTVIGQAAKTAFRVLRRPNKSVMWGDRRSMVSMQGAAWVVAAHRLTSEAKYLDALVDGAQFGMGANPFNMGFTTGLGPRSEYPYHHDFGRVGEEAPDGIPTCGPTYLPPDMLKAMGKLFTPAAETWPESEMYARLWYPALNEHTVNEPMATQAMVWGYVAQALR